MLDPRALTLRIVQIESYRHAHRVIIVILLDRIFVASFPERAIRTECGLAKEKEKQKSNEISNARKITNHSRDVIVPIRVGRCN
jgi:hypothetical protein